MKTHAEIKKQFPKGKKYKTKNGDVRNLTAWGIYLLQFYPNHGMVEVAEKKSAEPKKEPTKPTVKKEEQLVTEKVAPKEKEDSNEGN